MYHDTFDIRDKVFIMGFDYYGSTGVNHLISICESNCPLHVRWCEYYTTIW